MSLLTLWNILFCFDPLSFFSPRGVHVCSVVALRRNSCVLKSLKVNSCAYKKKKCGSAAGTLQCIMSAAMKRTIFTHTCTRLPTVAYMCFTFSLRLDFRGKFSQSARLTFEVTCSSNYWGHAVSPMVSLDSSRSA